ncbi:MAG TPA: hypothetical protein DCP90_06545 [Clostridiales bacterium]|nr:MAG: hypothetical protein A2Y22_00730 [Clostridiales bacterium GWD2_32_59]HAN10252.1 hypothetical protein [Clostridiales bacterium]
MDGMELVGKELGELMGLNGFDIKDIDSLIEKHNRKGLEKKGIKQKGAIWRRVTGRGDVKLLHEVDGVKTTYVISPDSIVIGYESKTSEKSDGKKVITVRTKDIVRPRGIFDPVVIKTNIEVYKDEQRFSSEVKENSFGKSMQAKYKGVDGSNLKHITILKNGKSKLFTHVASGFETTPNSKLIKECSVEESEFNGIEGYTSYSEVIENAGVIPIKKPSVIRECEGNIKRIDSLSWDKAAENMPTEVSKHAVRGIIYISGQINDIEEGMKRVVISSSESVEGMLIGSELSEAPVVEVTFDEVNSLEKA